MTALVATDVTVAITKRERWGKKHVVYGTLAFGDGALTYPTGGVPLPTIDKFGMQRNLDSLEIFAVNERTSDWVVKYGPASHTLLMYEESHEGVTALPEANTGEAPAARTYSWIATGW